MNTTAVRNALSLLQQLLLLGGMLIVGLFLASSFTQLIFHGTPTRESVLTGSIFQNLLAFIAPVVILPYVIGSKPVSWLRLYPHGNLRSYIGIFLIPFAALPAMHWLIEFNSGMHLPESMSGVEEVLRNWERQGETSSDLILQSGGVSQLIAAILCVGVLTGIGEEFFFRGGLQNILSRNGVRPFWAITIAAFIFSALHFQFFGFLPRMVMGLWFGWLYWRFSSVWPSAFAHALNNTMVVISTWGISKGWLPEDFEMYGVPVSCYTITIVVSCLATWLIFKLAFQWRSNRNH